MKTCEEIRRENLLTLIKAAGSEAALAERYGCSEANIKAMARAYKDSKSGTPKGIGSSAARKLEATMAQVRGWLDHDHSAPEYRVDPKVSEPSNVMAMPSRDKQTLDKLQRIVERMGDTGHAVLLYEAEKIASQYPRAKANPAS